MYTLSFKGPMNFLSFYEMNPISSCENRGPSPGQQPG